MQTVGAADATPDLSIPVRFHLLHGLETTRDGTRLQAWVTPEDITSKLLPEANRIWSPAGIHWELAGVDVREVPPSARTTDTVELLTRAKRDVAGRGDPRRVRRLDRLLGVRPATDDGVDVYIVPYLGESSQGNASPRKRRVYLGSWTDKPSRGRRPPEKFVLVETGPFRQGSMGRTLAHELGHILGLRHPDERTQGTFGRLMGGRKAGYRLTDDEIETARARAGRGSDS